VFALPRVGGATQVRVWNWGSRKWAGGLLRWALLWDLSLCYRGGLNPRGNELAVSGMYNITIVEWVGAEAAG